MSGVEVAGLVFGVLPIFIETIKAYSKVSDGLHTFRNYSKEVKSISRQFEVQYCIFLNHCRLLLRLVEDEKDVEVMLEDRTDRRWTSKELNDKLTEALKDSFELCRNVIEETKGTIEEVETLLSEFDVLKTEKQTDESIGSAIRRLRKIIKITFNKSKYLSHLASLRNQNDDLSALRAQITEFQTQSAISTMARHKSLPDGFQSIRNASLKLHEALCGAWCCDDAAHRGHYAKLCLNAEVQTEVCLDLAISCHKSVTETQAIPKQEPPIWLYVQSKSMANSQHIPNTSAIIEGFKKSLTTSLTASSSPSLKKKASCDLATPFLGRKKKKKVHFSDPSASDNPMQANGPANTQLIQNDINLCQTKNMCHYLQRNYQASNSSIVRRCLGYLETPCHMYKHEFYLHDSTRMAGIRPNLSNSTTVYSIFDAMRQEPEDVLQPEDQLNLAYKTAQAILQFNDTPWMAERWRLSNMSYFGNQHNFDEAALKTLHLSSQIASSNQPDAVQTVMDDIQSAENAVSDEIKYGINNVPLFFLGVALLEIAHWKPLESTMSTKDQSNPVYAARRLAHGRSPLGPEYQKIAQKCLQCNFGFGTKLSSKSLQSAVYNDVICELEDMIERLKI